MQRPTPRLTSDDVRTMRMQAIVSGTVYPWVGRLLAPNGDTEATRAANILGDQCQRLRILRQEVGDQAFKMIVLDEIAARVAALANCMADGGGR
jgi:hypothetical protein